MQAAAGSEAGATGDGAPMASRGNAALDQFTTDLTAQAKAGKIDPILGRDSEIRQIIDILTRRRQNNPILTGEAGVGKTAVVEGFAIRIASGDVPPALQGVTLRTLDLGLLQAGAGMKGEFENRLRGVIDEVKASPKPIILFIDEAHQLIGAGGAAGQNDAANLLKPALARGELRTIAATTWAEYKKYFEKDAALTRRFQPVKVDEPAEPMAVAMVRGLVGTLEKHHHVRILDEAVSEAVRLSARYIPSRQLPDKAVSLIDTACSRVGMSQAAVPPPIEDRQRRIALIDTEVGILEREIAAGESHATRCEELLAERGTLTEELEALNARWEQEKGLAAEIGETRGKIEDPANTEDKEALRTRLTDTSAKLRTLQGETPLIYPVVDKQAVAEVVSGWTGIPAGRMQSNEIRTVLNLKNVMEQRIVGQPHALEAVAEAIRTSRAGLTDPRKPIGVFLMVGTSGTGKTETALTLADLLYGGEQNMTTINMTEFKEEHKVSLLMGSPPGYVGYGEGGVLTEAVRRRPVFRDPAGRDGEGASRRAGHLLPGVRQGEHEGRRRPRHRLQEHCHHHDIERRHRSDHPAVRRSGNGARCRGTGRRADAGTDEGIQARLPGPRDSGAVFPAVARHHQADRRTPAQPGTAESPGGLWSEICLGQIARANDRRAVY